MFGLSNVLDEIFVEFIGIKEIKGIFSNNLFVFFFYGVYVRLMD